MLHSTSSSITTHPPPENSLIWVRVQLLKGANAAQLLLNRRYHRVRQPSSPVNTASAPRCPKWQNLVKKVGISTGGGFTFFKKSVKNHHFRQILIRKFKNSNFLTGVGSCFLQKKSSKRSFQPKFVQNFVKSQFFYGEFLSKKCPKSTTSPPI